MSGRILLAHKVASKNGIALFKTPDPPVELFEAVKAFHLVQYGQEKVERAVQRSSNVLRWMMESRRFQQDQTSLPKMVDELVKDKMPLAYILGKLCSFPRPPSSFLHEANAQEKRVKKAISLLVV